VDKNQLIKRLMATFLEELEEHVGSLNRDLLALEKDPAGAERAERLKTLFRTFHSLKGAARSVSVDVIEQACHQLEEILAAARDGQVPLSAGLFALLFASADAIEEAGRRLREEPDLAGAPLAALLPRLEAVARGTIVTGDVRPQRSQTAVRTEPSRSPVAMAGDAGPRTAPGPVSPSLPRHEQKEEPISAAVSVLPPAPAAPVAAPLSAAGEPLPEAAGTGTVRIAAEKLDMFLARSGELLVATRRVGSRAEDLAGLREFVGYWKTEWRAVEKALRQRGAMVGSLSRARREVAAPGEDGAATADHGLMPRRVTQVLERTGSHLLRLDKDLERLAAAMAGDGHVLDQSASALDDAVRRVRMLPFAEACQGLDRMARDLAQAAGKDVDLVLEGGAVELDRSVLEGLKDPLRHLVRNAVDHGAEPAAERRAAGKSPRARITVAAVLRGAHVEVVVADDGRGLDLNALRQQVRKKRLPEPADDLELARVIFLPGFSTARLITDVSGRGVGCDVVKSQVEALHGTVDLAFTPGRGTRFTLAVPLTLTTLRALLVVAGGQTFAFAGTNVFKLVRVAPGDFRSVEGRDMLALGGTPVPVAGLAATLGLAARELARLDSKVPVLVVAAGDRRMAFVVDEFLSEQEVLIKSLGARIRRVHHVSGATILPSGRIALVLNAANLIRTALARAPGRAVVAAPARASADAKRRVLVVDDSVTTRTLEKTILDAAGYEVEVAADGIAAWQLLQERGFDLIVSDVDMPRMDGFALTEAVRGSKRFHDLPVVLVTARENEQDKARGIEVGADAYLIKSAFDQTNLLETVAQLL
jgi:two-component system chemotaxis sensor kinase CheA